MPNLKSDKVQEKIGYKSIFNCSYSADSPLQKRVSIFLRNKSFWKYGWFKEKRAYFNVIVSKSNACLAIKYAYLGYKNWRHVFIE